MQVQVSSSDHPTFEVPFLFETHLLRYVCKQTVGKLVQREFGRKGEQSGFLYAKRMSLFILTALGDQLGLP